LRSCLACHRGRGVEKLNKNLTFEKMAAVMYIASVSILRIPPCLSVGRSTGRSGCGMWERARSSRSSRATGDCILRKVASLPRSAGERRRRPVATNLHPKYSSQVHGVSFSADGSLVASCSGDLNGDFSVRMWSVETGQELKKFLGHRCVVSGCCMRGVAVCACSRSQGLAFLCVPEA
jgi:WD40 repeat protein